MGQTNAVLALVADEVVGSDSIIDYLNVVKNNITMSAINCALIYLQKKDAVSVCGRKAWEHIGRHVLPDAKPIVLYFPSVTILEPPEEFCDENGRPQLANDSGFPIYLQQATYDCSYLPVNGFALESTDGEDLPEAELPTDFADNIITVTQGIPEIIKAQTLGGRKGKYSPEDNTFYISDAFDMTTEYGINEYNKTMIDLFVDYKMYWYHLDNMEIKKAVEYILFSRYGFTHNIEAPLFRKLDKRQTDEKVNFLLSVQYLLFDIIQDLEGAFLNFDETALVNDLLISSEYADMWTAFDSASLSITDELLQDEMNALRSKLMRSIDGYLTDLLAMKLDKEIFTFPPQRVHLDNVDYLRRERRELLLSTQSFTERSTQ